MQHILKVLHKCCLLCFKDQTLDTHWYKKALQKNPVSNNNLISSTFSDNFEYFVILCKADVNTQHIYKCNFNKDKLNQFELY